jgi:hypothetical protein
MLEGGAAFSPDGKNTSQPDVASGETSKTKRDRKKLRERAKVDLRRCL